MDSRISVSVCFFGSSTCSCTLTFEEYLEEKLSEFVSSKHVNQKVGGWIDSQHQMWDWNEDFQGKWRLTSWSVIWMVTKEGFKDVRNDFETLAENEHDYNTNQDYGHVFVLFLLAMSGFIDFSWHFHCHTLSFLHCFADSERNWHNWVQSKKFPYNYLRIMRALRTMMMM